VTERKEREKLEILLAKELEVEIGRRVTERKERETLEILLAKELELERGRREKEIATTKEEVSRRLLDFITSSSYKGLRDLVEVRNDGDPRK